MSRGFQIQDWGVIDYLKAYHRQKQWVRQVCQGHEQGLFLCEHPAVLTLGRMARTSHILVSHTRLREEGISVYSVDRGGDVTLHAPGQLVIYPILNLQLYKRDLHAFIRKLEQLAIALLKEFDIVADRFSGHTGLWVEDKKIVSIGIGVRRWVTFHGMAINVNTDLNLFSLIKPCGLDVTMTSMAAVKKTRVDMTRVKAAGIRLFKEYF